MHIYITSYTYYYYYYYCTNTYTAFYITVWPSILRYGTLVMIMLILCALQDDNGKSEVGNKEQGRGKGKKRKAVDIVEQ